MRRCRKCPDCEFQEDCFPPKQLRSKPTSMQHGSKLRRTGGGLSVYYVGCHCGCGCGHSCNNRYGPYFKVKIAGKSSNLGNLGQTIERLGLSKEDLSSSLRYLKRKAYHAALRLQGRGFKVHDPASAPSHLAALHGKTRRQPRCRDPHTLEFHRELRGRVCTSGDNLDPPIPLLKVLKSSKLGG